MRRAPYQLGVEVADINCAADVIESSRVHVVGDHRRRVRRLQSDGGIS